MNSDDGAASAAAAAAASTPAPLPAEPAAAASTAAAASAASSASTSDDGAAASTVPVVRMKKVRKRTAVKSSTTALDDDDEEGAAGGAAADAATAATDGAAAAPVATSLHTIRLMQKLRSKSATVLSLGESDLHLPEAAAASAAEWAAVSSAAAGGGGGASLLGPEFGAEGKDAQAALIDQQMEKYIAEQMAARRALRQPQKKEPAAGSGGGPPPVNLSEDQLFVTPDHLKIQSSQPLEVEEESGERWLTGIAEYSLSIQEKMANIEKTEAAKAKMLAEQASRRDVTMVLPANYNSNFKLHKKEWDGKRREEFRAFHDAQNRAQAIAQGLPPPPPSQPWARDAPPAANDPRALPGFLAGPDEPRRNWVPRGGAAAAGQGRGATQRGSGVPTATDDRTAERFIKRFKYK